MQERGYLEVCHSGASVVSATPNWDGTRVLDRARGPVQLKVMEVFTRLNHDGGYKLPDCWITTMKKVGGGANCTSTNHVGMSTLTSAPNRMGTQVQEPHL